MSAARERLPADVRALPAGSDLFVTFATGSVATMALNWVATARAAGVKELLIGALDEQMMDACAAASAKPARPLAARSPLVRPTARPVCRCAAHAAPCILIDGGDISAQLAKRSAANVRADPKLYPKMSVLKVGFYGELLSFGWNVWACDADAIIVRDPRRAARLDGTPPGAACVPRAASHPPASIAGP